MRPMALALLAPLTLSACSGGGGGGGDAPNLGAAASESSLRWQGEWERSADYAPEDVVASDGASWVALEAIDDGERPGEGRRWAPLAERGETGSAGPSGSIGPAGPQGPSGPAGARGEPGAPGPAGLNWRGPYVGGGDYGANDAVSADGSAWVTVVDVADGEAPGESDAWELLASAGEPGPAGAQGPAGAVGSEGPNGPEGPIGTTGPAGPRGPAGPAGALGVAGDDGRDGADGMDGSPGPAGPAGEPGEAGAPGLVWRGSWSAGASYEVSDATAHEGRSYVATAASLGAEPTPDGNVSWSLLADRGRNGVDGAAGDEGAPGPMGPTGERGADGRVGPRGATGAPGRDGTDGQRGPAGPSGPAGEKGPKGDRGPQGLQGEKGMAWQGPWSPTTSYLIDDVVGYRGSAYIATVDANDGQPPTDSTRWSPVALGAETDSSYEVVGFSSALRRGDAGYRGMNDACRADYGPAARIATTRELFYSSDAPTQTGRGWIDPAVEDGFDVFSLRGGSSVLNCEGWTSSANPGPSDKRFWSQAVDGDDLGVGLQTCDVMSHVTCSMPSATPQTDYSAVGFSQDSVRGTSGISSMHGACKAAYGAEARMATTDEVINAVGFVTVSEFGWVQRDLSSEIFDKGQYGQIDDSCEGWSGEYRTTRTATSVSYEGLVVDADTLSMRSRSCSSSAPVACSLPD